MSVYSFDRLIIIYCILRMLTCMDLGVLIMGVVRGTILRNMYQPQYQTYLVYRYACRNDAYCVKVLITESGEWEVDWNCKMWKQSVLNDREHYPIVGYIDLDELIKNHVLNEVSSYSKMMKAKEGSVG